MPFVADAGGLSGSVSVQQTSDTAAKAKSKAMNTAGRQIFLNTVSKYSDADALKQLLQNTSDAELLNFISSVSVANEQISVNGYSAKITMSLDNDAVKNWLNKNNVQNWIPLTESSEKFVVSVVVPNGIADWAELKRITRENNIEINTKSITGNNIIADMPVSVRTKFTAAVRAAGWKYADTDGTLQIWK